MWALSDVELVDAIWPDIEQHIEQRLAWSAMDLDNLVAERDEAREQLDRAMSEVEGHISDLVDTQARLADIERREAEACECTLHRPATHLEPAEWEQNPLCPVHPSWDYIRHHISSGDTARERLAEATRTLDAIRAQLSQFDDRDVMNRQIAGHPLAQAIRKLLDGSARPVPAGTETLAAAYELPPYEPDIIPAAGTEATDG